LEQVPDGWQITQGPEDNAHRLRRVFIARREVPGSQYQRFLYGDTTDLLRRITHNNNNNKESSMASKSDKFIEEYASVPRGGYSSQGPQAIRGTAQDFGQFAKGDVEDGLHIDQRVAPEDRRAFEVESDLGIESVNKRTDRV
jgi:hypothetical protein